MLAVSLTYSYHITLTVQVTEHEIPVIGSVGRRWNHI